MANPLREVAWGTHDLDTIRPSNQPNKIAMTLAILENKVEEARASAVKCAKRCEELISSSDLSAAIAVCKEFSIDAPQCSMTATSENAQRLRVAAARKMTDPNWWMKALEKQAIRSYDNQQRIEGKATDFVSDGAVAYHRKHKAKR
jgi:hypothetical protein